jgi:predicted ester cyclase
MGKVFSIHAIDLQPGVTDADLEDFVRNLRYAIPGQTVYLVKGDRGARTGQYAVLVEFDSVDLRDRYFPSEETASAEYNTHAAPFMAELERFGQLTTWPDPAFTDYQVLGQSRSHQAAGLAADANTGLIRRFVDRVWNSQEFDAIGEFHATSFTQNGTPTTVDAMVQGLRDWLPTTYPDLVTTIDDIITEGDKVAYRWTMQGTHQETGTPQVFRGHTFMRIVNGKIVEDWFASETVRDRETPEPAGSPREGAGM